MIKGQLADIAMSNSEKSEIMADIYQINAEILRPTSRREFVKLYLESLRDNLAKAAGAATAATVFALIDLVGSILAKQFGVF